MEDDREGGSRPRHTWPWFVLAALGLAVALAVLWMRAEIQRTRERRESSAPFARSSQPIADTAVLEIWRAELAALTSTNTTAADGAIIRWLDRLLAGQAPKEIQLEILEAAGRRDAPSVKEKLQRYETSLPKDDPLARFHDLLYGGSAERGRKIFFEKPEANCAKCHKVGPEGGEIGPPLTGITTNRAREYVLESIIFPNAKTVAGYETVVVLLKSGSGVSGILKTETDTELVINSSDEGLLTIKKADIQMRQKGLSPMPEGLWLLLSQRDLRDLVEFVAGLK